MGNTEEREYGTDEREAAADDVEGHNLTEQPPAERASDETDDVEAHNMTEAPPAD